MHIISILLITVSGLSITHGGKDDLDFEIEDETEKPGGIFSGTSQGSKQHSLQDSLLRAMQKPSMREQIGQVIPILRSMSPQQRLTLAALVSSHIMSPNTAQQSVSEVAQMFSGPGQNPKNVSEQLLLPISMDIANMFKSIAGDAGRSWKFSEGSSKSPLPSSTRPPFPFTTPTSIHRDVNGTKKSFPSRGKSPSPVKTFNEINRRNGIVETEDAPSSQDCDFLTSDICQEVSHYPEAEILGSIKKHLNIMEPFLTEFGDNEEHDTARAQRRQDVGENLVGAEEGHMCPSAVKYAKPKRSRTTSGAWKYIVNTGEYTQTLRLEICTKSGASCSFLNDHYKSSCQQVFNYHRLMCWDEKRGLHMDVFKVPSCCSCHIQGYSTSYPPDFQFAEKRRETIPISNSGVKREIPRPHPFRERPERPFFEIQPEGPVHPSSLDFPEDGLSETQTYQQRVPSRPVVFKEPSPPRHPVQNNVAQPQYNQRQPQFSVDYENPRFPDVPGRPHFSQNQHNSVDNPRPNGEIISHLVPPGPPLPLDFERPRPLFDHRRKNETLRGPEYTNEVPHHKRGTQKYEQTLPKPQTPQPQRTRRPVTKPVLDPAPSSAENTRLQVKPPVEGAFGSKIRGQKPQKASVYVTPSPRPSAPEEFKKPVRGTVRPPIKHQSAKSPPKKVNYNYHPIIDFFSPVGQAPFVGHSQNKAPIQFNRRQETNAEPDSPTRNYERNEPQYSQPFDEGRPNNPHYPQIHRQEYSSEVDRREDNSESPYDSHVPPIQQHQPSAHEWTPML